MNPAVIALLSGRDDYMPETIRTPATPYRPKRFGTPAVQQVPRRFGTPAERYEPKSFTTPAELYDPKPMDMYIGSEDDEIGAFQPLWDQGKTRREISDEGSELQPTGFNLMSLNDIKMPISEILNHPEIYKNYPGLSETRVSKLDNEFGTKGSYDNKNIKLNTHGAFSDADEIKSTLLHELQHAIQEKEGWARGGSPGEFESENLTQDDMESVDSEISKLFNSSPEGFQKLTRIVNQEVTQKPEWRNQDRLDSAIDELKRNYPDLTDQYNSLSAKRYYLWKAIRDGASIISTPHDQYQRLGGEIEARDTQARMNMPMSERRKTQPYASQGIPVKKVIRRIR